MLEINDQIRIPEAELSERFVHASGPGGQNVNKVATAVQLRFQAADSRVLPDAVRERLLKLAGRRATRGGEILIEARRYRHRERNREDARARLTALIQRAIQPPAPPRKKTRPSRGAIARQTAAQKQRVKTKRLRKPPPLDE